jgi:hypothetical protein
MTSGPEEREDATALQGLVRKLTNDVRARHGLSVLQSSGRLDAVARAHSADMCRRGFFDHTNPDGAGPAQRLATAFPEYRGSAGENIFMIDSSQDLIRGPHDRARVAAQLVDGWMESPGHRQNILEPGYTHLGVGIHATTDDVFATQLFSTSLLVFGSPPPRRLPRSGRVQLQMELGPDLASRHPLVAFLRWPDRTRRFPSGSGGFFHGTQPLLVQRRGDRAVLDVQAGEIPGRYELLLGDPSSLRSVLTLDVA